MSRSMNRSRARASMAAAILAMLALGSGCGPSAESPPPESPVPAGSVRLSPEQVAAAGVRTEVVALAAIAPQIEVPGTAVSPDTAMATVGSLVEGRVESVEVVPGEQVEVGAPLLLLHSHELTDALRDLTSAEAQLAYSEAALGRSVELLEAGAVSREEEQRRRAERDARAADFARAREWVDHLSPDGEGHVVVRAPRAGTVFEVSVRAGAGVLPGTPLVTLGATDVLWVTGWVPEAEIIHLEPGAEVTVRFPAVPHAKAHARVVRMGGAVDAMRRAVEVRVEIVTVPAGVRPGAYATLLIETAEPRPRAVVPAEAVQSLSEGDVVFIEDEPGLYRAVDVGALHLADGSMAVEGIGEGERVVVAGAYAIRSALESQATEEAR